MKKKLLSFVVALLVIASSVAMYNTVSPESIAYAAEFRSGFKLEPTEFDGTGIQVDTSFVLTEEGDTTLTVESVKEGLTITPDVDVDVTKDGESFIIRPSKPLPEGTVVVVTFGEVTWAFMTQTDFSLLGVFPRNESRGVPTSSGIELAFNYAPEDIATAFSIEPHVEGRFEYKDQRAIFIPKTLAPATVYTVTLKGDVTAKGSAETLGSDTVFQFQTAEMDVRKENQVYVQFRDWMNASASAEVPTINWDYYSYDNDTHEPMSVSVYAYRNFEKFEEDVKTYMKQPAWTVSDEGGIDVSKRSPEMTFNYDPSTESMTDELQLPDHLDKGQYLVQVTWEDTVAQTFLQVSDLSVSLTDMSDATLWWVHDLSTDAPLKDATIVFSEGDKTTTLGETDDTGFASIAKEKEAKATDNHTFYTVQSDKDKVLMLGSRSYGRTYYVAQDFYWDYLDTDKGLYQKDDTVQFFGFLQDRRASSTEAETVTVSLSESRFYYWDFLPMQEEALNYVSQEVPVKNGFYKGKLELPNLQEGTYQLTVSMGDTVISSTYLTVDSYTKPSYEMTLSHDKDAVFAGEPITFTLDARFFEGTPVAYLGYDYRVGLDMEDEGTDDTDAMGQGSFSYTPQAKPGDQGSTYLSAYVNADLPESGELYANDSVRVFYNDMYLERNVSSEEGISKVTMQLNAIDLDRYNKQLEDGDTPSYIGDPVAGHKIDVEIVEHQWKRKETGEHYDDINNEVVKEYEYYTVDHTLKSGVATTDADGLATYEVTLPDKAESYYTAEIALKDGNGRKMKYSQYLTNRHYPETKEMTDYPDIELNQENYHIGDEIVVNVTEGDKPLEADGYLYIVGQNGLVDASVSKEPEYERQFSEKDIPNTEIKVLVYRDGAYENLGTLRPTYDIEKERIQVTLTTDKDKYKPGDKMTVSAKATYPSDDADMPLSDGHVLIKMVDEALLALNDNSRDTLEALYQQVQGGFIGDYQSHGEGSPYITAYLGGEGGSVNLAFSESVTTDMADADMAREGKNDSSGAGVRSEFKDTAAYVAFDLDSKGEGEATITLPDNITGWKLTGIVMTSDLKAGDSIVPVDVSLPFFLNTALNSMYLTGDAPSIGATVYGNDISKETSIDYTVRLTRLGDGKVSTVSHTGNGYEQVAIPLGTLSEPGDYEVVVEAKDKAGHYDGYKTTFTVYDTYLEKVMAKTKSVSKDMTFDNEDDESVGLTFVEAGISRYLSELYHLSYASGKRVDQTYVGAVAKDLLEDIYDQDVMKDTVNLEDYRQEDGGYSLFPYGESEIETTVRMIPLIENQDQGNTLKTVNYLRNQWYNDKLKEKGAILYGLAILGEPILTELNQYADAGKHSLADQLYVAYAYVQLGDTYKGAELFDRVLEKVEEYNQQAFITGDTVNETVKLTGLGMLIAQDLNRDIAAKFYSYLTSHKSDDDLSNALMLDYIIQATKEESANPAKVVLSYQGQERTYDVSQGNGYTIQIPGATLRDVDIISVEGDVNVVMTYKEPLTSTEAGNKHIDVTRHYESYQTGKVTNQFKEGDIVKVVLDVDIDDLAIDDSYQLTDYVPSGLKPIEGYWKYGIENAGHMWYRDVSDQKVSFYAYRMEKNEKREPFVYYARIVSLGEFKAEAPMLQGLKNLDVMKLGETSTIEITKN